jgi:AraC-like DNA-binding protein
VTDPLVRSASLTGYASLARSLGLDPHRLAAEQGLPPGCLTNPDLKIPAAAVGRLLERSAHLAGVVDFGLRLAETRRLSNLGALGFVLREQPTLRKALDTMVSHSWAQNQAISLRLDVHSDIAILREVGPGPFLKSGRQGEELTLGVLTLTIRRLVGQAWRPRDVLLTHSRPAEIMTHRRVFGVTPLFDQDFGGLVIDARDLGANILEADPVAATQALRYVELEARPGREGTVAAVRELIVALLPTGACTIERVAAHLGVSRRTLHRRLAEANAPTFTDLLDEARVGMAQRYLAAGHYSLTEIAERLGYGSLSAFSRWRRHNLRVCRSS